MDFSDCISIAFGCRNVSGRQQNEPMLRQSNTILQTIFQKQENATAGGYLCGDWSAMGGVVATRALIGAQWVQKDDKMADIVHR